MGVFDGSDREKIPAKEGLWLGKHLRDVKVTRDTEVVVKYWQSGVL